MSLKVVSFVMSITIFFSISSMLMVAVYKAAFLPYMDEIFHIPQAQSYCRGNFSYWCPNITTPPGLYVLSAGLLSPMASAVGQAVSCSVLQLRTVNLFFALGNLCLIFGIFYQQNKPSKNWSWWHGGLTSVTLATFPTLYFFSFLYYTDAGSTFFVLLTYFLTLKKCYTSSAAMGAVSMCFRQTNVIWVGFCALLAANDLLDKYEGRELKKYEKHSWKYLKVTLIGWLGVLLNQRHRSYSQLIIDVINHVAGYAIDIVGFVLFLVWNGGIVLGDRSSHQAAIHIPQIFYFLIFTVLFASSHMLNQNNVKRFMLLSKKHLLCTAAVVALIVAFNTQYHRYNLSDNRHFNFYFYSKLIRRHPLIKFLLVPIYVFSGYTLFDMLRHSRGILWTLEYGLCLAANLVFQSLLEFRYFIIGYLLFRLNLPFHGDKVSRTVIELSLYTLVNIYTIYLFTMRPFVRPDDDVLSRFMW